MRSTKGGTLIENSNYQTINGDCLEVIDELIKNNIKVDSVITDIPYGTTACSWDSVIPFEEMWARLNIVAKDKPIVLFAKEPFTSQLINSNINNFKERIDWLKNRAGNGFGVGQKHISVIEDICVFCSSNNYTFNPQKWLVAEKEFLTQRKTMCEFECGNNIYSKATRVRKPDTGERNPINIVCSAIPITPAKTKKYSNDIDIRYHPTQKPLDLMEYLIKTFSNKGDTILDFTMGSGTTGVVALKLNRKFIGIEKDTIYYDISNKRIQDIVNKSTSINPFIVINKEEKTIENIKKIFDMLQNTSSRTEKENIIRKNKDNELFQKCLKFLLDGNITTGINKKKISKQVNCNPSVVFTSFGDVMDFLTINNTGTDSIISSVQHFIKNQTDCMNDFYNQMVTKSLKLGIDSKTVNKIIPNLIPTFEVMLGTPIDKVKIKDGTWFSISHKLNGCRCIYYRGNFYTRQGKKYGGLDHIKSDLQKLLINPNIVVDGELVYKNTEGLSDSEAFQKGTGIANSKEEYKTELKMVIFDILSARDFDNGISELTYKERKPELLALKEATEVLNIKNVSIVDMFYEGTDQKEIWKWLDYAENNDLEGVILNLDSPYECKRSKNLIKVKKFYDYDLEIIDCEEGNGRLKGTLGALVVDFNGNNVRVGSGFDDITRKELWENKENIIGRVAQIKYKEISKDKKTGKESLQFPIFITMREQGKEPSLN